jgi:hypothetical protein
VLIYGAIAEMDFGAMNFSGFATNREFGGARR